MVRARPAIGGGRHEPWRATRTMAAGTNLGFPKTGLCFDVRLIRR